MYVNEEKKSVKFSKIKFWQRNGKTNVLTESNVQTYNVNKPKFDPRLEYVMYRVNYNR